MHVLQKRVLNVKNAKHNEKKKKRTIIKASKSAF